MTVKSDIRALVVDNNPVLLRAIEALLDKEGCEVKTAKNGLEALTVLESFAADIIFTDLVMPLVSGEQLCRLLRNSIDYQDLYIVVISAIVLEDLERIQKDVDFDLCIAKGSLNELREHLKHALKCYSKSDKKRSESRKNVPIIPKSAQASDVTSELLAGKQHLTSILDNIGDGIIELTADGVVVRANNAALTILDCPENSVTGKLLDEAFEWGHYKAIITNWIEEELSGEGDCVEFNVFEDDPLKFDDKIVTATCLSIKEKGRYFGLCILHDISRQYYAEKHSKELDDAIKLVKKMDAMSCMAGGLAHDFNNLLTVICGNLELLSIYGEEQPKEKNAQLLEQTQKTASIAVDLTRQISCFSNFGIISREKQSFSTLVNDAIKTFFGDSNARYSFTSDINENLKVEVDSQEIIKVVDNVLNNSLEAAPEDIVLIEATKTSFEKPQLLFGQYVPAGTYAKVSFTDYGPGIDPESLVKIFDPYYSTKTRGANKGMGLGLTIVYATMRSHGGHAIVTSNYETKGKEGSHFSGTTVTLLFPAEIEVVDEEFQVKATKQKESVLLLDPDSQMRNIGKIMLSFLGFNVIAKSSFEEILEVIRQTAESGKPNICLAMIDVSQQWSKSGCRQLKELMPAIKLVAMGTNAANQVMEQVHEYGFDNSLTKPYMMDTLKHVIYGILK